MLKNYFIILGIFWLLSILQMAFFAPITFLPYAPHLILIAFFLMLFFKDQLPIQPLFLTSAGLFLDFFSPNYFGSSVIILLIIYVLKKTADSFFGNLDKHYSLIYFFINFAVGFFLYEIISQTLIMRQILWPFTLQNIVFQSIVALVIYYCYQKISTFFNIERQLKLGI